MTFELGSYRDAVDRGLAEARDQQLPQRLWQRDHTLWQPDPTEIANRLGWLDCPAAMAARVEEIAGFVAEVRRAGYTHALLLGMGGSSLAPEVFRTTFGVADGHLDLAILDSTEPRTVRDRIAASDPATTLYVVSTKSGGTVETHSLFLRCYREVVAALGRDAAGAHFAAITDPGSRLEKLAAELGFRRTFRNDPEIGGRYSALSYFGLVPAALVGVDLARLLGRARDAAEHCRRAQDNPGVALGTTLGELAREGRDKLTLMLPEPMAGFGDWVEQLVAESMGKRGRGILPVVGEQPGAPDAYGKDRVFAVFGGTVDAAALTAAGHPVLRLPLEEPYDLGYQFFLWEVATAVAGARLGVNPFDQPDVESAKVRAQEMVAAYRKAGTLPAPEPTLEADGVGIWAEFPVGGAKDALTRFLGQARPGDYLAVHAYLPPRTGRPTPPWASCGWWRGSAAVWRSPWATARASCTPPVSSTRATGATACSCSSPATPRLQCRFPTGPTPTRRPWGSGPSSPPRPWGTARPCSTPAVGSCACTWAKPPWHASPNWPRF